MSNTLTNNGVGDGVFPLRPTSELYLVNALDNKKYIKNLVKVLKEFFFLLKIKLTVLMFSIL